MGERETLQELVNDFEQRQKEAEAVALMCADIDDNDGFVDNQISAGVWSHAASIVKAKMSAKYGGS